MADTALLIVIMAGSGAVAGFLAGLLGVGGGIVLVPAIYLGLGAVGMAGDYQMHMAIATSLANIIPTGLSSALSHNRRGALDLELIRRWAPWLIGGAVIGVFCAARLKSDTLSLFFGCLTLFVGVTLLRPSRDGAPVRLTPGPVLQKLIPGTIGVLSTLMGIGGATLSVPVMTKFYAFPIHRAVGTSSFLGLVIAIPAVLGYIIAGWNIPGRPDFSFGFVSLPALAALMPLAILMAPLGARASHKLNRRVLSVGFGLFLIATGVRILF